MDPAGIGRARLPGRFWLMMSAAVVSMLGDGVAFAAFPLLAAKLAGANSGLTVAALFAAGQLPSLAALHIGVLVDRVDRRRAIRWVETTRGVLLVGFAVLVARDHAPPIWTVAATVFLIGLGQVVTDTALQASLPLMVADKELGRANGLLFSAQHTTEQMAGPALGGVLFAALIAAPFALDSASFFVAALLLPLAVPAGRSAGEQPVGRAGFSEDLREGISYFRSEPLLKMIAAIILAFAFCQAMMIGTLVVFAKGPLGLGAAGFGLLISVVSVGNVLGGLLGGPVERRWRTDTVLIAGGGVAALSYMLAGATTDYLVVGIALFVEGVAVAVANVATVTARQKIIPAHLLGRTFGVFRVLIFGAIPLGALAGGVFVDLGDPRTPLLVAGGLQLLVVSSTGMVLSRRVAADRRLA